MLNHSICDFTANLQKKLSKRSGGLLEQVMTKKTMKKIIIQVILIIAIMKAILIAILIMIIILNTD